MNKNKNCIKVKGTHLEGELVVCGGVVVETEPALKHYMGLTEARAHELVRQKSMSWIVVYDEQ